MNLCQSCKYQQRRNLTLIMFLLLFKNGRQTDLKYHDDDENNPMTLNANKISEMCSFVADGSCKKCAELKACFWCQNINYKTYSEGRTARQNKGECYATIDRKAAYKCRDESFVNDKAKCEKRQTVYKKHSERGMLINLISLLKNLHSNKISENQDNYSIGQQSIKVPTLKPIFNTTIVTTRKLFMSNTSTPMAKETFISSTSKTKPYNNTNNTYIKTNKTLNKNEKHNKNKHCGFTMRLDCKEPNCTWNDNKRICMVHRFNVIDSSNAGLRKKLSKNEKVESSQRSCQQHVSCSTCTKSNSCYWCSKMRRCQQFFGHAAVAASECGNLYSYGDCNHDSQAFIIIVPLVGCMLLLGVAYTCVKNCYYHQLKPVEVSLEERPILFREKNGRTIYQINESDEEEDEDKVAEKSGSVYQKHGKNHPS